MPPRQPKDRQPAQKPRAKKADDIHLFKAVVTFVFVKRNDKGEVIQEIPTNENLLYLPDFGQFPEKAKEALESVKKQLRAQQNGSG